MIKLGRIIEFSNKKAIARTNEETQERSRFKIQMKYVAYITVLAIHSCGNNEQGGIYSANT